MKGMLPRARGCRCKVLQGLRLSPRPAQSRSQRSPLGWDSICQPARGLMPIPKSWRPRKEQDLPVLTHQIQSSWAPGSQRPLSPCVPTTPTPPSGTAAKGLDLIAPSRGKLQQHGQVPARPCARDKAKSLNAELSAALNMHFSLDLSCLTLTSPQLMEEGR